MWYDCITVFYGSCTGNRGPDDPGALALPMEPKLNWSNRVPSTIKAGVVQKEIDRKF
jgi:hypothetical protein